MKIKISVDDHGIGAALDDLGERLSHSTEDATGLGLHMVEAIAKKLAPIRTGRLRGSIRVEGPSAQMGGYAGRVGPHVIYANIQEFGGVIVPKRVRFLHWVDAGGEHWAKRVTIPAHPYMRPALAMTRPNLSKLFEGELEKAVAE